MLVSRGKEKEVTYLTQTDKGKNDMTRERKHRGPSLGLHTLQWVPPVSALLCVTTLGILALVIQINTTDTTDKRDFKDVNL